MQTAPQQLLERYRAALIEARLVSTDFPSTLALVEHYLRKVKGALAMMKRCPAAADVIARPFNHNGLGPAIEDVCQSARFHGVRWDAERRAASNRAYNAHMNRVLNERAWKGEAA